MKQLFTLLFLLGIMPALWAQAPETLNYQGVARNAQGQPYSNKTIVVRLKVHDGTPTGTILYSEERNVTTNAFGLFTVVINSPGASQTGSFANIDWNKNAKFLETEIDANSTGAFTNIGTTQMQSVPYALLSAKATKLVLPYTESVTSNNAIFDLTNTSNGRVLEAKNSGAGGAAYFQSKGTTTLWAVNNSNTAGNAAIAGTANGTGGTGVTGQTSVASSTGVSASNTGGGLALTVFGGLKISGGNTNPAAGKVLTSDAQGNATWQVPSGGAQNKVGFSVNGVALNGLQFPPAGQWYKLHCYNEEYDPGNDYTLYNGASGSIESSSFRAPVAGLYHFDAKTTIMGASMNYTMKDALLRIQLKRNGVVSTLAQNKGEYFPNGEKKDMVPSLSENLHLLAGDQVWIELWTRTVEGVNPTMLYSPQGWHISKEFHSFSGYLVFAD